MNEIIDQIDYTIACLQGANALTRNKGINTAINSLYDVISELESLQKVCQKSISKFRKKQPQD